jgi:four helix bundle protein
MEVDCQLDIAQMVGYISPETYTKIENDIELIAKRLSKLRSSIPE